MPMHLSKPVQDRIRSEIGFHLAQQPVTGEENLWPLPKSGVANI